MTKVNLLKLFISIVAITCNYHCGAAIIADHNSIDITQIPQYAIEQAKATLHIAYGHTSHGSQVTNGMSSLVAFANDGGLGLSLPTYIFAWNNGGIDGALDLHDYFASGDLGNPDRVTWAQRTRDYLDNQANLDVNVIMWSWCGQASTTIENIDIYLDLMEELIADYPNVYFVFMTGHLDGTGPDGRLNRANEHIRNHCITYDRILYDFADIESYDPDGLVNYMELYGDDGCDYDSDGDGSLDRNWADDWQNTHTANVDWYECSSAHTRPLNGNMKAYAAWWLWAKLAKWNGCPYEIESDLDDNCQVDLDDFDILARCWMTDDESADIVTEPDTDIIIDINDLIVMATDWLSSCE